MIFIPESENTAQDKNIRQEDVSLHLWKNLKSANIKHKKQLYDIIAVKRPSGKTGFKATYNNIDFTRKDIDEILEYLETSIDQE